MRMHLYLTVRAGQVVLPLSLDDNQDVNKVSFEAIQTARTAATIGAWRPSVRQYWYKRNGRPEGRRWLIRTFSARGFPRHCTARHLVRIDTTDGTYIYCIRASQ